jgi:hypothetical protein
VFYDWLVSKIRIPGFVAAERDPDFDDEKLRSRAALIYPTSLGSLQGVEAGVLLEVGFDDTAPNRPVTISSWAYDAAVARGCRHGQPRAGGALLRAQPHLCRELQTLSTKYRGCRDGPPAAELPAALLKRVCLLAQPDVLAFGTSAYEARKRQRFRAADELVIARNPAFAWLISRAGGPLRPSTPGLRRCPGPTVL